MLANYEKGNDADVVGGGGGRLQVHQKRMVGAHKLFRHKAYLGRNHERSTYSSNRTRSL
jgi:hypothetical protein